MSRRIVLKLPAECALSLCSQRARRPRVSLSHVTFLFPQQAGGASPLDFLSSSSSMEVFLVATTLHALSRAFRFHRPPLSFHRPSEDSQFPRGAWVLRAAAEKLQSNLTLDKKEKKRLKLKIKINSGPSMSPSVNA